MSAPERLHLGHPHGARASRVPLQPEHPCCDPGARVDRHRRTAGIGCVDCDRKLKQARQVAERTMGEVRAAMEL